MKPTEAEIIALTREALTDDAKLEVLWNGLSSKSLDTKQRSYLSLHMLTEVYPERIHARYWDRVVAMLDSGGVDSKYIAIYLLAGMAGAKGDTSFESVFDKYFGLLDDNSLIIPMHVAINATRIFKAKPLLRDRITGYLLRIDQTHHTPGRKALIAANAIESLDKCFEDVGDKPAVIDFVKSYLDAPSPKARKTAKEFLKRRGAAA